MCSSLILWIWLVSKVQGLDFPVMGLWICPIMPYFLCGCWDLMSGLHVCVANKHLRFFPSLTKGFTERGSLALQSFWPCWCEISLLSVLSLLWHHHMSWNPHQSWTEANIMPLNPQNYELDLFTYKINLPWGFHYSNEN